MADEFEGSSFALMLIEQETGLRTKEVAPAGVRLPFDRASGRPGQSGERHDQVTGLQVPGLPLAGFHDPSMQITAAANLDSLGWWLRHALAIGDTTGIADPYTHAFGLGNDNGMPIAHEIAMQNSQADATAISRLYWGGRISTFGWALEAKGALMLDIGMEFYRLDAWDTAHEVAAPTEYDSELMIDLGVGIWNIDSSPVGYLTNLRGNIDRRLTPRHPAGVLGLRSNVSRGVPQCGGSFAGYLDDDVVTDVLSLCPNPETGAVGTPVDMSFVYTLAAGPPERSLTIELNGVYIYHTEETIGPEGVDVSFDWIAGGVDCVVWTLVNSVEAYAPA